MTTFMYTFANAIALSVVIIIYFLPLSVQSLICTSVVANVIQSISHVMLYPFIAAFSAINALQKPVGQP